MKTKMLVLTCALALTAGTALAGASNPQEVLIDLDERTADGAMSTARYSDNDLELIGCGVSYYSDGVGGVFAFGFCQAQDANEVYAVCYTEDLGLIEAIQSISDFSFVRFSWDETEECTQIYNSTQSFYLPNYTRKGNDK